MTEFDINTVWLSAGRHATRDQGVNLMEAEAWWLGQQHRSDPAGVSPVLQVFGSQLNDMLEDKRRQKLKPLLATLSGTVDDGKDAERVLLMLSWLLRTYTTAWLDLAGLRGQARALRDLAPITDLASAQRTIPAAEAASAASWLVVEQTQAVGGDALAQARAWDVEWSSVWDASWSDAWETVWEAAFATAEDAAELGAWTAVWDAAWTAAREAARAAAYRMASEVGSGEGAWERTKAALQPTVDYLQESAIGIFVYMINPGMRND